MSTTLSFVDRLLKMGQDLQQLHQDQAALRLLRKLASMRGAPPEMKEETHARLAEICLRQHKYVKARRHLTVALSHDPDNARYHYLMATALISAEQGNPQRALRHFRRSLELDGNQPACLADLAMLLLSMDRIEEGLQALRRAVELSPDDPLLVGKLLEGLDQTDRSDEARDLLQAARFRHPRDRRFGKLYGDYLFRRTREQQADRPRIPSVVDEGPVLLPFAGAASDGPDGVMRRDEPAPLPPPHARRQHVHRDQKHG